jgi:hypothetical protein
MAIRDGREGDARTEAPKRREAEAERRIRRRRQFCLARGIGAARAKGKIVAVAGFWAATAAIGRNAMQTEADVHNAGRCEMTWKRIRIVERSRLREFRANEHFDFTKANYPKTVRRSGSQCRLLDRNPIWTAHHAINRRGTKPVST